MELAGRYSKHSRLLDDLVSTSKRTEQLERQTGAEPATSAKAIRKKVLTYDEVATIIAKYEAGASLVQLRVEHRMAKRTVARVLRENGVTIRSRGGERAYPRG
ncbi:hypothetical protein [Nocardia fluminea]|uniref:hypothetical protein n=1 Tax=Nocardia fluminea TaxID=134984 RepID=UPI00364801D1